MCRTLNKINEGFALLCIAPPFIFMFGFGSAACCGFEVLPQDDAFAPLPAPAKIFLQSASTAAAAVAVNEKHISMMHASRKQHQASGYGYPWAPFPGTNNKLTQQQVSSGIWSWSWFCI